MNKRFARRWRRFWVAASDTRGVGRVAARIAAWGTLPYHGRGILSAAHPCGYVAPSARLAHPGLKRGFHVLIGDRVVIRNVHSGGPIELADRVELFGDTFLDTDFNARIEIGTGTHVQPGCHFHAHLGDIRIGRFTEIAANCAFYSYNHGSALGRPMMDQPLESPGPIILGDNCWIGHGVTVLAGVTIGSGAIIGAGSVVTRSIPENAIAAGVPARVLKYREETTALRPDPGAPRKENSSSRRAPTLEEFPAAQ